MLSGLWVTGREMWNEKGRDRVIEDESSVWHFW